MSLAQLEPICSCGQEVTGSNPHSAFNTIPLQKKNLKMKVKVKDLQIFHFGKLPLMD